MFLLSLILFAGEWIETTQADFRDGWFSRELYCSHRKGGAVEFVARFDLNNDGYIDLPGEGWILWGSKSGYSYNNSTLYQGSAGCDVADLNIDGYPELVSTRFHSGASIYWGTKDGPDPNTPTYLEDWTEGIFIADFNKDGYLDILSSSDKDNASIHWGSGGGFPGGGFTTLPCDFASNHPEAADLNKDGWLDAIVVAEESGNRYIYWGGAKGFSSGDRTVVPFEPLAHGVSVADINSDGWLDMVFTSRMASNGVIVWGRKDIDNLSIIEPDLYLPLPGDGIGGSQIADLNYDGYLDVLFYSSPDVPNRIYCGTSDGISLGNYSDLGSTINVSTGGLIADLDYDGDLDIFAYDRSSKKPSSRIFWGPSYNSTVIEVSSHHGMCHEIGNVYTRDYEEIYNSSIHDAGEPTLWGAIHWEDSCPGKSFIDMEIRWGDSSDTSTWGPWRRVQNNHTIPGNIVSRYIQYRAIFTYDNPSYLPVLYLVEILPGGIIVRPDRNGAGFPGDTITYQLWVINYTERPDVVDIRYRTSSSGWYHNIGGSTGAPLQDTDGDGYPDVGELNPLGDSAGLTVRAGIPGNASAGHQDTMIVYGYSSNVEAFYDSALVITSVLPEISITVNPDYDTVAGSQGGEYAFELTGTNWGKWPDVIDLSGSSVHGWGVELMDTSGSIPLLDNDADGVVDLGSLGGRGGNKNFTALVSVPSNILVPDTVYVTGRSSNDNKVSDDAVLVINPPKTTSLEIKPDQEGVVTPSDPVETYPLSVINHGNTHEIGEISYRYSQGWPTAVYDSTGKAILQSSNNNSIPDVGEIDPLGGSRDLFVEVKMPEGIYPSLLGLAVPDTSVVPVETTWVYVTVASESLPRDSAIIITAALPILDIHNFPNPFSGFTTFVYSVPVEGSASLSVFNRAGEHIATIFSDKHHVPGTYRVEWEATVNGEELAPGVYLYVYSINPSKGRKRSVVKKALLEP